MAWDFVMLEAYSAIKDQFLVGVFDLWYKTGSSR